MSYDRLTDRIDRIDRRLDLAADAALERARRDVKAMRRADALDAEEERSKARRDRARCGEHQSRYDSVFAKHGVRAPAPAVDARPPTYRRQLFTQAQSLLPSSDHPLNRFDAAYLDGSTIPELERQLLEAVEAQGENPTGDNLPLDVSDPRARREVADSMGAKKMEYHAKRSFIADLNRTGRKVARIIDAPRGRVIWGVQFPHTPG
jgi:hypothetical protein